MNRSILTTITALGLMAWSVTAMAGEDLLNGKSAVGAHYTEYSDQFDKVGEYFSDSNAEEFQAHAFFKLYAPAKRPVRPVRFYRDKDTKTFGFDLKTKGRVSASFDYQSFIHHLDHDQLTNLQAREGLPDDGVGGKQVYHHDMDPMGRYWLDYSKMSGELAYDLTGIPNGKLYVRYSDQHKSGWKQTLTIDHCATCHVESNRREVDEQTRMFAVGTEGTMRNLTFNYEFEAQDFTDFTDPNTRTWTSRPASDPRRHLARDRPDEQLRRRVRLAAQLPRRDPALRGGAHDGEAEPPVRAEAGREQGEPREGLLQPQPRRQRGQQPVVRLRRLCGRLGGASQQEDAPDRPSLMYEVKADDAYVDLLNFRMMPNGTDTRPGGGQDFDWTRISAANREVLQTDLAFRYKLGKGSNLNLDWRHKVVDRSAMNQTQTSYYYTDAGDVMVPSEAVAYETTTDRFRASWMKRFSRRGNARVQYSYTTVDQPFMNMYGICEEGLHEDGHALTGNATCIISSVCARATPPRCPTSRIVSPPAPRTRSTPAWR